MDYRIWENDRGILCASIDGITLHSMRNPQRESDKLVERSIGDEPEGVIVFGSGLLYHLQSIRRIYPEVPLICLEPDASWLEELEGRDLNPHKHCDELIIMEGDWEVRVQEYLSRNHKLYVPGAYRKLYRAKAGELDETYRRFADRRQVNRNTLKRFGTRWVGNLLANYLLYDQSLGINRFIIAFRGIPALLLAGGPSLSLVLPHLKEYRKRMLIVAVDTAYGACRDREVEPDFVVAVDPQYWNTKHIERIAGQSDGDPSALLISESSAHPRTFRLLNNTALFSQSLFPLGKYLETGLEDRIPLGSGGSVATTAWDFIRIAGCPEVYAAGLDMGFPMHQTHFKGSYFEQSMAYGGTRLSPAEQASALYLYSGQLSRHPDYGAGTVLSDRRMDIYCNWFERQVQARREIKTRTLFEGGRMIPGISFAPHREVMALPEMRDQIDAVIASRLSQELPIELDEHPDKLETLNDFLRRLEEHCGKAREIIRRAKEDARAGNDKAVNTAVGQLDEIDRRIMSEENRRIAGFLINDVVESISTQERARSMSEALERSDLLYRELSASATQHLEIIERQNKRFKFGYT